MKGCIKSWLSLKSSVSKTAMCRLVKQQSPCADDPTKPTVNFPAYAGQALHKKKIYGWLCWCLFLWFVSFGQAKESNSPRGEKRDIFQVYMN